MTIIEHLVQEPNVYFWKCVAPPYEKVIFAFKRSYIISEVKQ